MSADFESIHNHHETSVFEAISAAAPDYPLVTDNDLLPDVACVALNRLPPRYIRHKADMSFYLSERERSEDARAVGDAVRFAFGYVQARRVMKVRG
ncbi:MAG: late competence development ComFB family protein [Burkholderiales bacterium]